MTRPWWPTRPATYQGLRTARSVAFDQATFERVADAIIAAFPPSELSTSCCEICLQRLLGLGPAQQHLL